MIWRSFFPYWGLITLIVGVAGWATASVGPPGLAVLFALSLLWFLFRAPVPCGAPTRRRDELCRNNARGILRGCRIEQHKWQRLRSIVVRPRISRAVRELFPNAITGLASLGALVSLVSTVTATVLSLVRGPG
ncbi:hypothetical protein MTQ01_15870 [Streptomyces sp. XM4193]|uniref:hypothetical protein n=1 Tax=Streptomyces sp. XM4193 TaxID=2929782 RepID=UPI001FF91340|nr:hypothetical protein [Streptomyces sp. XM4193]MCK1797474.1 hypothetical protein [Streptomyces sp. XM4193]